MRLPPFEPSGDLPTGVHRATLAEVLGRFGSGSRRRQAVALRLRRIHEVASATNRLKRFIVFGSFVTTKLEPNDVDVFLVMVDRFEAADLSGEALLLFDHMAADAHFGASVFWLRSCAALGGEESAIQYWQAKRDGGARGIVEVVPENP